MFPKRKRKYKTRYNMSGTKGWIENLKYNMERYFFTLHRITGIGLVIYLIIHIIITSSRMYGEEVYTMTEELISNPIADIGLFIVMAGIIFHGVNGLRLIIHEFGLLLGKPKRPEYPYREILKTLRSRLLIISMLILGVILLIIVAYELLLIWVF
jgi:succinate dehydrogenase / fumarate reductase cytochrome b subunit